jgi:tripartite ATP-independent transporter DctP family solute receptor
LAILIVASIFVSGMAGEKPRIEWKVGTSTTDSHPIIITLKKFGKALSDATNGRWTLNIYANGTIGTDQDVTEMTRTNTLAMCTSNFTIMETYIPDFGAFALPYLFRSWDDLYDYVNNQRMGKELFERLKNEFNLQLFHVQLNGTRCLSTNFIAPIKSPADLKGVKIRSMEAQVWQDVISALGGTAIPVNFAELYMALQTGVVNGQDNSLAVTYSGKFHEVINNFYHTDHSYNTNTFWVNPKVYAALDNEDRSLCNRLIKKYLIDNYYAMMKDFENVAEDAFKKANVRIWEQSEIDMPAFYKSADELINRKYLNKEVFGKYIRDIRKIYNY